MAQTADGDDGSAAPATDGGGPSAADGGRSAPGGGGAAGDPREEGMVVRVNGERRRVPRGLTVSGLLEELGVDGRRVAVERNRRVVPRDERDEVELEEDDEVEIVQFVGGGR